MTRHEVQKQLEEFDASYAFDVEEIHANQVMGTMMNVAFQFKQVPKDQRIRHYQIAHQHIQELLKDPEPDVDYSNMSGNELVKCYESIDERAAELERLREEVKEEKEEACEDVEDVYWDYVGPKEYLIIMCDSILDSVTGFLTTMMNMISEKEEEDADDELLIIV
ncbi:hypothetical protein B9Z55_011781 [Caenorhabditis nigoni]|nr:hypothetical protein B9Z55_011781 [Caenorhabditis nigoni]